MKYASDEYTRSLYEEKSQKISEIQKGILAVSSKEQPYDVFICYKEATDGGSRTKDSVIAQDIYHHLTKEGCRVFFSKITLEDKLGQQYEPYIFSALNSAKVMLVLGTCREYFESIWVKNEWSRFLALKKKDPARELIPCYRDMDAYDMPDELSGLQSQDMGKIGFIQDLVSGVKKILGAGTGSISDIQQAASDVPVKIPKRFTDKYLEDQKSALMRQIGSLESKNNNLQNKQRSEESNQRDCADQANRLRPQLRAAQAMRSNTLRNESSYQGLGGLADFSRNLMAHHGIEAQIYEYEKAAKEWRDKASATQRDISRNQSELTEVKVKLEDIKTLLRKKPVQRVEEYYQELLNAKNNKPDEEDLMELEKQFREMEGYKDTQTLAEECKNNAIKVKYSRLVQEKNQATTDGDYRELAQEFRGMRDYENAAALASECESQYRETAGTIGI